MEKKEKIKNHILPFFWLRGEDALTIQEEMDQMENCGIREFCVESRPHPDFCGPLWWENMDFILEEAKKRGMRAWILDDDKFPTGHCNGALEGQPEKEKFYLAERHMDIMGPCEGDAVLVENFMQPDGRLLGILACPKPDGETLEVSGEGSILLTDRYRDGFVYFDLPPGPYRLFVLFVTQRGGGRDHYMNLIDEASVKVLLDNVYEPHYARYSAYFGHTLAGFFSDEPELGNVPGYPFDVTLGKGGIKLPWSSQLEKTLEKEWKQDFLVHLVSLWYGTGPLTVPSRAGYMQAMTNLVRTCFSGQIGKWCSAHGVEYIGHIIEDDNAHARMGCSIGHYFREMEGQHMAGVDVVHHQIVPGFTEPVHQWIAGDRDGEFFHFGLAKLGSSAAHMDPKKKNRALCEIFGNYGWAEGNSLMKWLTNHMLVRGINQFTPHAFSMRYPDRDCPPHFYARGNNPAFPCFQELMRYMERGAAFLSEGIHQADAAILYHGEAEWAGEAMLFQKPGRKLMEHQLDYDVVPADLFSQDPNGPYPDSRAYVKEGHLHIHQESYSCLILPYAQYIEKHVAEFVVQGAKASLPVFLLEALPQGCTDKSPLPQGFAEAVTLTDLEHLADLTAKVAVPLLQPSIHLPDVRQILFSRGKCLRGMLFNESTVNRADMTFICSSKAYRIWRQYDPWALKEKLYAFPEEGISVTLEPGEALFFELLTESDQKPVLIPVMQEEVLNLDWDVWTDQEALGKRQIRAGEKFENLNGPGHWQGHCGSFFYRGCYVMEEKKGNHCIFKIPRGNDSFRLWINGKDCGWMTGAPVKTEITHALLPGNNEIQIEVTNTLIWKRKDGASTHLQIPATGILQAPVLLWYE